MPNPSMRLHDLKEGDALEIACWECKRKSLVSYLGLIAKGIAPNTTFLEIKNRSVCSKCGSRSVSVTIAKKRD